METWTELRNELLKYTPTMDSHEVINGMSYVKTQMD